MKGAAAQERLILWSVIRVTIFNLVVGSICGGLSEGIVNLTFQLDKEEQG
ncbi:hypothetical protein NBRC116587_39470 [Pseudoteredinibacter isoporae]